MWLFTRQQKGMGLLVVFSGLLLLCIEMETNLKRKCIIF